MDEETLAEYFYEHRDELAGEIVPSTTPARLNVAFSVRFSRTEAEVIRVAAEHAGLTPSEFLRRAALAGTEPG